MMHNAKYKTEGLAAVKSAIGKVFIFSIKEPQERSGLFAVARSPSGSLTTKMVIFSSRGQTSEFSSQRKPVKKVADIRHPTTLSVAFPPFEYSAKPVGGIIFTGGAFRFYHHRKPVKKDSDDSHRRPHGSLHNEITLFRHTVSIRISL